MARKGTILNRTMPVGEVERPVRSRKYQEYFLIACEDQSTEPYYFEKYQHEFDIILPHKTVYLKAVGTGRNSVGVVEQAIEERNALEDIEGVHIDQTWAVFDKDDLDASKGNRKRFEEAFELAKDNSVKIAYSNECFELWLLLYMVDVNPFVSIGRKGIIYPKLEDTLNKGRTEKTRLVYRHDSPNPFIVDAVVASGSVKKAIERAKALDEFHLKAGHAPIESNPNTWVYKLVDELEGRLEWYREK